MRSVLITGGVGFIGFSLAKALAPVVQRLVLCDVASADRTDKEVEEFLAAHPQAALICGDLLEADTFHGLGGQYDVVFHLAARVGVEAVEKDPIGVMRNNILGTMNLLEWFARSESRRLVFSSTSEVYAGGAGCGLLPIPTPETVPAVVDNIFHPRSSYAISKLAGEHLAAQYAHRSGSEFVVIRYHNVYGPRMGFKHVVPQMMRRLASVGDRMIVQSPHHTRAFCYVDDAVNASLALARCPDANGRIVHVGNDQAYVSILELASLLCEVMQVHPTILPGEEQIGSVARRRPDISLLRQLTGFTPQIGLKEGLRRSYEWYKLHL